MRSLVRFKTVHETDEQLRRGDGRAMRGQPEMDINLCVRGLGAIEAARLAVEVEQLVLKRVEEWNMDGGPV